MTPTPDPLEAAARFAAGQPGWTRRVFERHVPRDSGSCAGCGTARPAPWPCLLVHIARRAARPRTPPATRPDVRGAA